MTHVCRITGSQKKKYSLQYCRVISLQLINGKKKKKPSLKPKKKKEIPQPSNDFFYQSFCCLSLQACGYKQWGREAKETPLKRTEGYKGLKSSTDKIISQKRKLNVKGQILKTDWDLVVHRERDWKWAGPEVATSEKHHFWRKIKYI